MKEIIKLDFDWYLKGLDGNRMEGVEEGTHAGQLLAGLLSRATEVVDSLKFFNWALRLYNKQDLQLDKSDYEKLKKFVEGHKQLFVIAKAQLEQCIIDAKDIKE